MSNVTRPQIESLEPGSAPLQELTAEEAEEAQGGVGITLPLPQRPPPQQSPPKQ